MAESNALPLPTGPRIPGQPRPWTASRRALFANADILEIIAEFACGAVADACELRLSCTGFRRAVDTTVRRLALQVEPQDSAEFDSASHHGRLPLNLFALDEAHLAFADDSCGRTQRLVVAAFALDGPKDPLRESSVCGERPVSVPWCPLLPLGAAPRGGPAMWGEIGPLFPAPPSVYEALRRCLTCATVTPLCVPHPSGVAACHWPRLALLDVEWRDPREPRNASRSANDAVDCEDGKRQMRSLACFLQCVGPQLTQLVSDVITDDMCDAISNTCTQLTSIRVPFPTMSSAASRALSDALIASGAPLTSICGGFTSRDAVRLMTAVPTIVDVWVYSVDVVELPQDVVERLHSLNNEPLPRSWHRTMQSRADWVPSVHAKSITVWTEGALPLPDLASAFPRLEELTVDRDVSFIDTLRFPPSLKLLHIGDATPDNVATALVRRLKSIGHAALPCLRSVVLDRVPASFDLSLLTVFAGTLAVLALCTPVMSKEEAARHEAVLRELVNLEAAIVPNLPTARCFFGGRHKRLRDVSIQRIHTPDAGAPFASLLKACPQLRHAEGTADAADAFSAPGGWRIRPGTRIGEGGIAAVRASHRE
jgi:hypothetical protein